MTVGQKIHDLRKKKGISQEELGFELDVSRQTISRWEADMMQPTTDNLRALCDYFQVDPNFILNDNQKETAAGLVDEHLTEIDKSADICAKASVRKPYSRKQIIVLSILISISAIIFIVGAIISAIAISIVVMPSIGMVEHHVLSADIIAIVCSVLSLMALVAIIIFIILLKRNKNRQK